MPSRAPYPQLHLSQQLCFPLYTLSRLLTQAYQPLLRPLGLTYPQYLVLLVMWEAWEQEREWLKVGEICDCLALDTGTVTPLLKRMERAGWVTRVRSDSDQRVVSVGLTDAGRGLREQAARIPEQLLKLAGDNGAALLTMRDELRRWLAEIAPSGATSTKW